MRDDNERLLDILESIERIEKYSIGGRAAFEQNELIQIWMLHNLQIMGEAVRALSSETVERAPEIEWSKVIGMRNILVHNYFSISIDTDLVWAVIENDLPKLKESVRVLTKTE